MRCLLAVSLLLCWSFQAAAREAPVDQGTQIPEAPVEVRCKNDAGVNVDWFILYKASHVTEVKKTKNHPGIPGRTGLEYVYIDQTTNANPQTKTSIINILRNTLRPMLRSVRLMPETFGFISYSDQPPGCSGAERFGHSKGVVMGDRGSNSALWLTHSTPQFPMKRDLLGFWPPNGNANAQTFMCVSLTYADLTAVGKHLQNIRALPFDYDLPADFPPELRKAVDEAHSKDIDLTTLGGEIPLKTRNQNNPNLMAWAKKNVKESVEIVGNKRRKRPELLPIEVNEGDLYLQLAGEFKSDIIVQTWGQQKDRTGNVQDKGHSVINIDGVITAVGGWDKCNDHSKWAVTSSNNHHWTCIGDSNRSPSQSKRPGGALCIRNQEVTEIFRGFIDGKENNGAVPVSPATGQSSNTINCPPMDTDAG